MKLPVETIDHDGESFDIGYDEHLDCGECDHAWRVTTSKDDEEGVRTEPAGETTCPACGASNGHTYVKRAHYYVKYSAIPLADPPLSVEPHAECLRRLAREFEALEANGWELVQSDGVHLDFEKVETESTTSEYEVTDTLE